MRSKMVMVLHSLVAVGLSCILPLMAVAQTKPEYPICPIPLFVGEVPDHPFTAQLVKQVLRVRPDGSSVPESEPESLVSLVARDSNGRVLVRSQIAAQSPDDTKGWQRWAETLCDPARATITNLHYRVIDNAAAQAGLIPSTAEGAGQTRPQREPHTTRVFAAWHNVVDGRNNMALETFHGVPAYRFRLTRTREENSIYEVVNGDELSSQLAQIVWRQYPSLAYETALQNIRRSEPDPGLFDIPSGVKIAPTH